MNAFPAQFDIASLVCKTKRNLIPNALQSVTFVDILGSFGSNFIGHICFDTNGHLLK